MKEYDYVIVGGGTAGSVLARRLTEDADATVLVLEAGSNYIPSAVNDPSKWYTLIGSRIDWGYESVPQAQLGGRKVAEPRGKAPGGTSNLYAMIHTRGHPSDYDNWAYSGAPGWSYANVLPYFKRIETQEDPTGPWSGTEGPQRIRNAGRHSPNPASSAFIDACIELGYPKIDDFSGPDMLGSGWHRLDIADGRRESALVAYLEPALNRPNLTLRTSAYATRLLFDGGHCVGVEYQQEPEPIAEEGAGRRIRSANADAPEVGVHSVRVNSEVLVCAGTMESPKLLMLSGIGPATQLREFDIPVVVDLPGVGENFQNHVLVGVVSESTAMVPPPTQNFAEGAMFTASQPGWLAPDLQFAFGHSPFDFIPEGNPNSVTVIPGVMRTFSRGWIRLASTDPLAKPLINPNYFADRSDLDRLVQGVKIAREIFATNAFLPWFKQELSPGSDVSSDADIANFVRHEARSYFHHGGSCKMGIDDFAVVDPELRVHGVTGLRVVDASIMPALPSCNTHTAVLMIAERGSDLIAGVGGG